MDSTERNRSDQKRDFKVQFCFNKSEEEASSPLAGTNDEVDMKHVEHGAF